MTYIYRIINSINGKSYIGKTKRQNLMKRWTSYFVSNSGPQNLRYDMVNYGIENFVFEIVMICSEEDDSYYEAEFIRQFNTTTPYGYNRNGSI